MTRFEDIAYIAFLASVPVLLWLLVAVPYYIAFGEWTWPL